MSYQFEDAEPVKIEGAGRKAEPTPFDEIVQAIALKTDDKGRPVAKSFTEEFEDEESLAKIVTRIRGLMTRAGDAVKPDPVTVRLVNAPAVDAKGKEVPNTWKFTFWTIKKKVRTSTATASTEQSTAVAEPAE